MKEADNGGDGDIKPLDYAELDTLAQRLSRPAPLPTGEASSGSTATVSKAKYKLVKEQLIKAQVKWARDSKDDERRRETGGERERGGKIDGKRTVVK